MENSINYRENLFERDNLNPIRGETTFKTIHKPRNEIKANVKSLYSNIGGGSYGHPGLVLTDAQYALILNATFVYPTHPGPIIIPDGTTAHIKPNMRITHTKAVRLFREVMGLEKNTAKKLSQ